MIDFLEVLIVGLQDIALHLDREATQRISIGPLPLSVWVALGVGWLLTGFVLHRYRTSFNWLIPTIIATGFVTAIALYFSMTIFNVWVWAAIISWTLAVGLARWILFPIMVLTTICVAISVAHAVTLLCGLPYIWAVVSITRFLRRRAKSSSPSEVRPLESKYAGTSVPSFFSSTTGA